MKKQEQSKGREIGCPLCGRKIAWNHKRSFAYGSPFRVCEGCGKTYYDERYREICTDGIYSLSGWCSWYFGLTAAGILFAVGFLSFFLLLSMDIYGIAGYPAKKKRVKKLELESVARMRDPEYRKGLEEKGKKVLDKYASCLSEETDLE